MASNNKIEKIYDLSTVGGNEVLDTLEKVNAAFKQIADSKKVLANSGASAAAQDMEKLDQSSRKVLTTVSEHIKQTARLIETQRGLAVSIESESKARENNNKALIQEQVLRDKTAKAEMAEARLKALITKEIEKKDKAVMRELESQRKMNDAYEQLKLKYREAAIEAKKLSAEFGMNSLQAQGAVRSAQAFHTQLLEIETAVGQSQRNVGNYTNATFALTQVLREGPAFANSFATGIQGISNNVPMLVEEFNKLKTSLGSTNKAANVMFQSMFAGTGIVALLTTAITIGVTLWERYNRSAKKTKEAVDETKEAHKELVKEMSSEIIAVNELVRKASDATKSYKQRVEAVDELQSKYPDYFGNLTREQILVGDVAAVYDELTQSIISSTRERIRNQDLNNMIEQLASIEIEIEKISNRDQNTFVYVDQSELEKLKQSRDLLKDKIAKETKLMSTQREAALEGVYWTDAKAKKEYEARQKKERAEALMRDGETKRLKDSDKEYSKHLGKRVQDNKDASDEIARNAKAAAELERIAIEAQAKGQRKTADDPTGLLGDRAEALKSYYELKKSLITLDANLELSTGKLTQTEIVALKAKADADRLAMDEAYQAELLQMSKDELERENNNILKNLDNIAANEDAAAQVKREALLKQFQEGKISQKNYEDELTKINEDADRERIQNTIDYLQSEIDLMAAAGADTIELQKALNDAMKELYDKNEDNAKKANNAIENSGEGLLASLLSKAKLGKDEIKGLLKLFDGALQVASTYNRMKADLQMQDIDRNFDEVKSEEEKEKKKRLAFAQSAAEREAIEKQYEERAKEAERKRNIERQEVIKKQMGIEYALGLIKAISTSSTIYEGIAKVAVVTAEYYAALAVLNNQKFEHGGEVPKEGGEFGGKPHSQGGTKFWWQNQSFEAEAKEIAIINKKSAQDNKTYTVTGTPKQIASAINEIGGGVRFEYGARIKRFEYGGSLGSSLQPPVFQSYFSQGSGDMDTMKDMIKDMMYIVNSTDKKPVVLNPNYVTDHQKKQANSVALGTI